MVVFKESQFVNARGQKIYTRSYAPDKKKGVEKVVVFLHGIGEHCGRFHVLFETLANANIAIYALDHQGHGKSDGERADCSALNEYVEDINMLASTARLEWPKQQIFIAGISFGGLLAVHTVLSKMHPWSGMILAAPAIGVEMNLILTIQSMFVGILTRVAPTLKAVPAVHTNFLSRDVEFVKDYEKDPLVYHGLLKIRMGNEIFQGMEMLKQKSIRDELELPLLIMHGDADKVTNPVLSKEFFDNLPSKDKVYKSYPGMYHCIFHEPEKKEVAEFMLNWIQNH